MQSVTSAPCVRHVDDVSALLAIDVLVTYGCMISCTDRSVTQTPTVICTNRLHLHIQQEVTYRPSWLDRDKRVHGWPNTSSLICIRGRKPSTEAVGLPFSSKCGY